MRLSNKVAIITGGAGNLGSVQVSKFANEGALVVIADIDSVKGKLIEEDVANNGGKARFVNLDVTKESSWIQTVKQTEQIFGTPTVYTVQERLLRPVKINGMQ